MNKWTKFKDQKPPFKTLLVISKSENVYDVGEIIDKTHFRAMDGKVYTLTQDWFNNSKCDDFSWFSIPKLEI